MRNQPLGPITFDGALPPTPDRKADLDQRKRNLLEQLKELEAGIGKS